MSSFLCLFLLVKSRARVLFTCKCLEKWISEHPFISKRISRNSGLSQRKESEQALLLPTVFFKVLGVVSFKKGETTELSRPKSEQY